VQLSVVTENTSGGAGLQNQYGKNLTVDKILRILLRILQGFSYDHIAHSQINSRRKESLANSSRREQQAFT
jgi:hypothetical protein